MKKITLAITLTVALLLLGGGAATPLFASTVNVGTLTTFTGGETGEGLDLSGNIIYAFNLGPGAAQSVQGVTFVAASKDAPPAGITTTAGNQFDYSGANPGGANGADYGSHADDDALETIVNTVWYDGNWTFDLAVTPGTQYQLQLILQKSFWTFQGGTARNFDISVETASPDPAVTLDGDTSTGSVDANAPSGTQVGLLSMLNTNPAHFAFSLHPDGADTASFDIPVGTTNLNRRRWRTRHRVDVAQARFTYRRRSDFRSAQWSDVPGRRGGRRRELRRRGAVGLERRRLRATGERWCTERRFVATSRPGAGQVVRANRLLVCFSICVDRSRRITYDTIMRKRYQVVMDSNVFVSALRSRHGASFRMLSLIGTGNFDISLSVPLVLEYEQVARRSRWRNKPSWAYVSDILDYVCDVGRKHEIHFLWRPRERDPKDDMVLEVAVAGQCDCIVTYNKRDFTEAPSFGLELLTPKEFLERIGALK